MSKDCSVTVTDERAEEYESIFGTATVYVQSPIPVMCKLEGLGEELCYMLDLELLSSEQRDRLVAHIARKFKASEKDVDGVLTALGMPIRANDTTLTVSGATLQNMVD